MFPNCFMEDFFLEIHGYVYEIQDEIQEYRYFNECSCSYYGLGFIAREYNGMSKSIVCTPCAFHFEEMQSVFCLYLQNGLELFI